MAASPQARFPQRALCGEHGNVKARQPTERIWVICTSKTWDSAQPGRAWPCDPAAPKLPGSLTGNGLIYLLWSEWRIRERPWRGIPPSGYGVVSSAPGGTQLVTGTGLILSLCPTELTFPGCLRKTSTAQSSRWLQRLQRQITHTYTDIVTRFQIKGFKPPKEDKTTADFYKTILRNTQ